MANDELTDDELRDALEKIRELGEDLLRSIRPWEQEVEQYVDRLTGEGASKLAKHLDEVGADDITNGIPNWKIRETLRKRKGV